MTLQTPLHRPSGLHNSPTSLTAARSLTLLLAMVAFLFASPLHAQLAGKGSIRGTVADSTGAAIPGAAIVITNVSTAARQQTLSTGAGDYQFSLDPGKYTIAVTRAGFKTFTQENVVVDALQTFSVNPVLETAPSVSP